MLKKILSPASCAECRWCCQFDENDMWEMPVLSASVADKIRAALPSARVGAVGESSFLFDVDFDPETGLAYCPALTHGGCVLGDDKPFDCRIWPFRVMSLGGRTAITMSLGCPAVSRLSLSALKRFLDDGFAKNVFSYARENPDVIKTYDDGFPILMFEP